jgi:hypothetical protein
MAHEIPAAPRVRNAPMRKRPLPLAQMRFESETNAPVAKDDSITGARSIFYQSSLSSTVIVIAEREPAIHRTSKEPILSSDGCAGRARA